jgi:hypothetical protein
MPVTFTTFGVLPLGDEAKIIDDVNVVLIVVKCKIC